MKQNPLEQLKALGTIGGAISLLLAGAVGAYLMYQFVAKDVPALQRDVASLQKELREGQDRQTAALRAQGDRIQSAMVVLQTEMMSLIQRVERRKLKPAEMREILKNVQQVSEAEAQQLSAPQITGDPPQMPPAVTATAQQWPADFGGIYAPMGTSYSSVDNFIARALFAKNSKWEAIPRGIKVTYDGGAAVFTDRQNASFEQLKKRAELFNMFSGTLHEFVPVWTAAPQKLPSIRDFKNPKETGDVLDVVPQRAPSLPGGTEYPAPATPNAPSSIENRNPATIK